jgi:hypothetical protein
MADDSANYFAMGQALYNRRRDEKIRALLAQSATPATPEITGEAIGGGAAPQPAPARPEGLDINSALPALAKAGFGPEAIDFSMKQMAAGAPLQKILLEHAEKQQEHARDTQGSVYAGVIKDPSDANILAAGRAFQSATGLPHDQITNTLLGMDPKSRQAYLLSIAQSSKGGQAALKELYPETSQDITSFQGANQIVTKNKPGLLDRVTGRGMVPAQTKGGPGADLHGADFLATLDPQAAAQVKALTEGRMQFPGGFALKSPYWQNMLSMVSQYDPEFDYVNYNARAATRKSFTSGPDAREVEMLNTVSGHLKHVLDAGDALNNTSYPIYNHLGNFALKMRGDPRVDRFNYAKEVAAQELTRAYRGAGGAEADIVRFNNDLSAAASPEQIHGVLGQMADLLQSKIEQKQRKYQTGMGTTEQPVSMISPQAQQIFETLRSRAAGKSAPAQAAPSGQWRVIR